MLFATNLGLLATATAFLSSTLVLACQGPFHSDPLNRTHLWANKDVPAYFAEMDKSFFANLKAPKSRATAWPSHWIPESCQYEANKLKVNVDEIEVFKVWYDDCSTPWVFCRHKKSLSSKEELIAHFGLLPIGVRQYARTIQSYSFEDGGGNIGYERGADIVILDKSSPWLFVHEIGHVMDYFKVDTNGTKHTFSSKDAEWKAAVEKDTCVNNWYAFTGLYENFAEVFVLALFDAVTPGGLNTTGRPWQCLQNQKNFVDKIYKKDITPGGTCTRSWPQSPPVYVGNGNGKPDTGDAPGKGNVMAWSPNYGAMDHIPDICSNPQEIPPPQWPEGDSPWDPPTMVSDKPGKVSRSIIEN